MQAYPPIFPYWSLCDRRSWTIVLRGDAGGVRNFAGRIAAPRRRRNARAQFPATPRIHDNTPNSCWREGGGRKRACGRRALQRDDPARMTKPASATERKRSPNIVAAHAAAKKFPYLGQSSECCLARIKPALGRHGWHPSDKLWGISLPCHPLFLKPLQTVIAATRLTISRTASHFLRIAGLPANFLGIFPFRRDIAHCPALNLSKAIRVQSDHSEPDCRRRQPPQTRCKFA